MPHLLEIHGWVPAGPLSVDDTTKIDLEVPFEISDGKLEILPSRTPWHQFASSGIQRLLEQHYPSAIGGIPVPIGENMRRPDVAALLQGKDDLLRQRLKCLSVDMIQVAVEVISHVDGDAWKDRKSVERDRDVKFHEYASAGIQEYWIVDETTDDPADASVEIYHLRDDYYAPVLVTRLSKLTSGEVEIPKRSN